MCVPSTAVCSVDSSVAVCKYGPKCSQVINYTKSAFSIQICSVIPYGAHLGEPAVNCFKPSPSGDSLPGIHSPVAEKATSTKHSCHNQRPACQALLNKSVSACRPEQKEYGRDLAQQREMRE